MTAPDIRTSYVQGLRRLADLLEQTPLALPYFGVPDRSLPVYLGRYAHGDVLSQAITYATAMTATARPTAEFVEMDGDPAFWLELTGVIGGVCISVHLRTDEVCARAVGGWVLPAALAELVELIPGTAAPAAPSVPAAAPSVRGGPALDHLSEAEYRREQADDSDDFRFDRIPRESA